VVLPKPLVPSKFVKRLNRFAISVKLRNGQVVTAHLPNSGRLHEVLKAGNKFWLAHRPNLNRRTEFDAILAKDGNALVSVDARLPPKLLLEGIKAGIVRQFGEVVGVRAEIPFGNHRLDLQLRNSSLQVWWVETKSVTLVSDGVALFPDAPTIRGQGTP
jgi:sugar fermentation stimulation protein A